MDLVPLAWDEGVYGTKWTWFHLLAEVCVYVKMRTVKRCTSK